MSPWGSSAAALRVRAAFLMCLAVLGLGACGLWFRDHEIRYRLTLEVATPHGIRTGTGVIEVTTTETPFWAIGNVVTRQMEGEAIPIDLPGGRTLFALLNRPGISDEPKHRPFEAFRSLLEKPEFDIEGGTARNRAKQFAFLRREKPSALLEGRQRPFLVRFRNPNDPGSIEEVDPDALPSTFGEGYRLLSVIIEITDDDVTRGIERRLPWLGDAPGKRLRNAVNPNDFSIPATLEHGAFVRGG